MRVGFIHGVMNTDNISISGETIDYGPCAFMDEYHPQGLQLHRPPGRYAYKHQPDMAAGTWRSSPTLLPLIGDDGERAMSAHASARRLRHPFDRLRRLRAKIGLTAPATATSNSLMTYSDGWPNTTPTLPTVSPRGSDAR